MAKNPNAAYEIVTEKIVTMLESGTVPWRKPWSSHGLLPTSMSTGKPYRGINPFLLNMTAMIEGYASPYWGTYDQITARGGQVRKGEKSTLVVFWKRGTRTVTLDDGSTDERGWAVLRYFRVFNTDQADWPDGLPKKFQPVELADHDPIENAEMVVEGYFEGPNAPTLTFSGAQACYSPSIDTVLMPPMGAFDTAEGYYSTVFHEATHSTGHKSRLDREGITESHFFGDESYAKEELVAEMGAAMLAASTGIEQVTLDNSAAYLASWVKVLRGEPKLVVQAAAQAQRAVDLILGTEFDNDQED